MARYYWFLPLLSSILLTFGQKDVCQECEDLNKGWAFYQSGKYNEAIEFYQRSLKGSEENDNTLYKAYALIDLGIVHAKQGDYNESISNYQLALDEFELLENIIQQFHCLRNIGLNYNGLGLYETALKYYNNAENLIAKTNHPNLDYLLNISVGRVYEEMEEYDLSYKYYLLAQASAEESGLSKEFNEAIINIGNIYSARGDLDSALVLYQKAYDASVYSRDSLRLAYSAHNLGESYLQIGEFKKAEVFLLKALALNEEHSSSRLPATYNVLAELYLRLNFADSAYLFVSKALKMGLAQGNIEHLLESYEALKSYHEQTGNYEMALDAMEKLDSLRTQRFNSEKLAVNKLKASYDIKDRDEQIAIQDIQLRQERLIRWIALSVALTLLAVAFIFYYMFKTNLRLKKKNEVLLKEQNHRVKNNLQMISSLLSLQSQKLLSSDAKEALTDSQARVNSVALLHRMLYEGDQVGFVDVDQYLKSLTEEVKYASHRELEVQLEVSQNLLLKVERATSLGLILNELMTNSIKHARTESLLLITISINESEDQIILDYRDNGEEMDLGAWESSDSFGNQLIKIQSEQMNGKYRVSNSSGFSFNLRIVA